MLHKLISTNIQTFYIMYTVSTNTPFWRMSNNLHSVCFSWLYSIQCYIGPVDCYWRLVWTYIVCDSEPSVFTIIWILHGKDRNRITLPSLYNRLYNLRTFQWTSVPWVSSSKKKDLCSIEKLFVTSLCLDFSLTKIIKEVSLQQNNNYRMSMCEPS